MTLREIDNIINRHYCITDLIEELEHHGIICETVPMGAGGVGHMEYKSRLNQIRMQIGKLYKTHYAHAAILPADKYLQEFQDLKKQVTENNQKAVKF